MSTPTVTTLLNLASTPFIAYFGAASNNASLLQTAYLQCGLYRQVLLLGSNSATFTPVGKSTTHSLWHHIVGPQSPEPGLWSTGNGWAAMGMARVLAAIFRAPAARNTAWRAGALTDLTAWIKEIVDGARAATPDGGLLRNYIDDTSGDGRALGEISGSALIAAVEYRMVVHAPQAFKPAATYVKWADGVRGVLGGVGADERPHVTSAGIVTPAVNPLAWGDTAPWTAGSPEGNNFVVLLYATWWDCIFAGVCAQPATH
ncbi:hypothetical protein C8R47DRAFT_1261600 [Mycena vitilis]|nr:hypothetical protein C8R47DRAFT_1261600 [Mycena vitilis]